MVFVLDCNIWLSLALNRQLQQLDSAKKDHNCVFVTCKELADELTHVALRPKFKKYFPGKYVEELISFHLLISRLFTLNEIPDIVTDEKDNYLFALCEASNADYFVTGDKLLLDVKTHKKTSVITLAGFKEIINTAV